MMKLEFLGWASQGLRCADLDFDFCNGGSKPPAVVLIQMPNGTGKTTTLNCIRAALTGEATEWDAEKVEQFAASGANLERGSFELRLKVDEKLLTISMMFDYQKGRVRYTTTYDKGRVDRFNPPPSLKRFLTDHFVRLLVFDGELPGELLDERKTRAEEAVDAFFQLYLLHDVADAVQRVFDDATQNKTATKEKGLKRRQATLDRANEKIKTIETAIKQAKFRTEQATQEKAKLDQRINQEISKMGNLNESFKKLEEEQRVADHRRKEALRIFFEELQKPHRVHTRWQSRLLDLREHLDRLKLPESTSRQFFEELAEEDLCVCGRPLDDASREVVRDRAERYLGADTYGALNHLKTQIQKMVPAAEVGGVLEAARTEYRELDQKCGALSTQLSMIKQQLVDGGSAELQKDQDRSDALAKEIEESTDFLAEAARDPRSDDDDESLCLKYWQLERKRREKKLAEITETVRMRRCKDAIVGVLAMAHEVARQKLSEKIVEEMNQRVAVMLKGHGIQAKGLDRSIRIVGQDGASQGQTLALGYSFLTTLFGRGGHEFPFVVDAPVTALDGRVRKEVASIVPRVCLQFIAFIIDTEKPNFVDPLETNTSGKTLYLTAFERSDKNADLLALVPKDGVKYSSTGVIVSGREYFDSATFPEN